MEDLTFDPRWIVVKLERAELQPFGEANIQSTAKGKRRAGPVSDCEGHKRKPVRLEARQIRCVSYSNKSVRKRPVRVVVLLSCNLIPPIIWLTRVCRSMKS